MYGVTTGLDGALLMLYEQTKDQRYLDFCTRFEQGRVEKARDRHDGLLSLRLGIVRLHQSAAPVSALVISATGSVRPPWFCAIDVASLPV
jgi:DUF1680 family protein